MDTTITRDPAMEIGDVFFSPAAFEKYSQLAQVLDVVRDQDQQNELLLNHCKPTSHPGLHTQPTPAVPTPAVAETALCISGTNQSGTDLTHRKMAIRIPFPRLSYLTVKQHSQYLTLHQKFLKGLPQLPTQQDIKDLNTLKELQPKVSQEQDEFMLYLEMVARQASSDYNYFDHKADRYMKDYLHKERLRVQMYPCFHRVLDVVPLTDPRMTKTLNLQLESILLEMGRVFRVIIPKASAENKISVSLKYNKIKGRFPTSSEERRKLPPCSQDPNCIRLARKYQADVVMCASALTCLLDNQAPSYTRQWELPFKVIQTQESEESDSHSTLFIDKPFVPRSLMPRDKNEWYHRFATKTLFQHPMHSTCRDLRKKSKFNPRSKTHTSGMPDYFETTEDYFEELDSFGAGYAPARTKVSLKDNSLALESIAQKSYATTDHLEEEANIKIDRIAEKITLPRISDNLQIIRKNLTSEIMNTTKNDSEVIQCETDSEVIQCETDSEVIQCETDSEVIQCENDSEVIQCETLLVNEKSLHEQSKDYSKNETTMVKSDQEFQDVSNACSMDVMPGSENGCQYPRTIQSETKTGETSCVFSYHSDSDNTEDEKLVIDAMITPPRSMGKGSLLNLSLDPDDPDLVIIDEEAAGDVENLTKTTEHHMSTCHTHIIEAPTSLSLDTPLSPTHTGVPSNPGHSTPDTPLSPTHTEVPSNPGQNTPDTPLSPTHTGVPSNPGHNTPVIPLHQKLIVIPFNKWSSQVPDDSAHCICDTETPHSPPLSPGHQDVPTIKIIPLAENNHGLPIDVPPSLKLSSHCLRVTLGDSLVVSSKSNDRTDIDRQQQQQDESASPVPNVEPCPLTDAKTVTKQVEKVSVEPFSEGTPVKRKRGRPRKVTKPPTGQKQTVASETMVDMAVHMDKELGSVDLCPDSGRNLRKRRSATVSSVEPKNEEPMSKRGMRVHTTVLPVERLLHGRLPSVSKRRISQGLSQLDGNDDKLDRDDNTSQSSTQTITASRHLTMSGGPLDNILQAQSRLLELPSQPASHDQFMPVNASHDEFMPVHAPETCMDSGEALEDSDGYEHPPMDNVSYSQYTLGDLRLIVRHHYHGILIPRKKQPPRYVQLQPKLEYQPQYGFECLTHTEICKAWVALQLRPGACLHRVHINACSGDIMEQETLTSQEIIPHRSVFQPGPALCNLHQLLEKLRKLDSADYLLSHTPGQQQCHIKTTTQSTIGVYDLHRAYLDPADPATGQYSPNNVPWIPIDRSRLLPFHRKYQRIPATFEPKDCKPQHTFYLSKKKNQKKPKLKEAT